MRRSVKRPDELFVLLLDENIGGLLVHRALSRVKGVEVRRSIDEFGDGVEDVDLIPQISERGWHLVTKDSRMRKRPVELWAIAEANLHVFFLTSKSHVTGSEIAELLLERVEDIRHAASEYERPCMFSVTATGVKAIDDPNVPAKKRLSTETE